LPESMPLCNFSSAIVLLPEHSIKYSLKAAA
jgi:hypothetical protein